MAWWNDGSSLANSIVSYWKLDEASGNRADSVGTNTLTDNATVTSDTGRVYPLAADFTAANAEYLSCADNASLSTGNISFWIAAWVKADDLAAGVVAGKTTADSNAGYEYAIYLYASGELALVTGNGTAISSARSGAGTVVAGQWYLVVGYHDHTTLKLYVSLNTATPIEVARGQAPADTTKPFEIGRVGTTYKNMVCGPVAFGKNYIPTAADILAMYRDAPTDALDSWWLGNGQISSANVLEHVEIPSLGQNYAGSSVADGQPWTVAIRSAGFLASANVARYLFDSQDGRFLAGINTNAAYGTYNGTAWSNAALFTTVAEHVWMFVSNGATVQAYLDNVAVGSAQANTTGLAISGATKWASDYLGANTWTNPILVGSVYNTALTTDQRLGLYLAMRGIDQVTEIFTANGSFVPKSWVTSVDVEMWGAGGAGGPRSAVSGGGRPGGGGGAYAAGALPVTPSNSYTVTVGPSNSSDSSMTGDSSVQVLAKGGGAGTNSGGVGAAGGNLAASIGTVKFAGGNGGNGSGATQSNSGGAGGAAASALGTGATGANAAAVAPAGAVGAGGGGSGGFGGNNSSVSAPAGGGGVAPGGGGGGVGGSSTGVGGSGGSGARGQVNVTWAYPPATTTSDILGTSDGTSTAVGILKGSGGVDGLSSGTSTAVAILKAKGRLVVVTAGTSIAVAIGHGSGALRAITTGTSTVAGILKAAAKLRAAITGTSTADADISGKIKIFSAVAATSTVSGILRAVASLQAAVAGSSTAQAVVHHAAGRLAGNAAGTCTVSGRLTNAKVVRALADGTSTVTGTMRARGKLVGQASGTVVVFGHVKLRIGAVASIAATSTATGILTGHSIGYIFGNSQGTTVIIGAIIALAHLRANASGTSSTTGILIQVIVQAVELSVSYKGMYGGLFKKMR